MILKHSSTNGYAFGFKWSLLGIIFALFYITSCELIIPPDRSVPRYNTVRGEKKRPMLNPGGSGFSGYNSVEARGNAIDYAYGNAAAPSTSAAPAAPLPPAPEQAPVVQEKAVQETVAPKPRMQAAAPLEEKSFWSKMAFWREDEKIVEAPISARRRPMENDATLASTASVATSPVGSSELAPLPQTTATNPGKDPFPTLSGTPEKPSFAGIDNSKQRAMAARNELEADRTNALAARDQLAKDAVAEPSLLANPPAISQLPPPPASMNAQQAQSVAKQMQQSAPAASSPQLPAGSAFERLTQSRPATSQPVAVASAPVAVASPKLEPIMLTPPPAALPEVAAPVTSSSAPAPFASVNVSAPPAVSGLAAPQVNTTQTAALEPITLTPPAPTSSGLPSTGAITGDTASGRAVPYTPNYLPQSRYAQRRR